jgi:hypothetical protein
MKELLVMAQVPSGKGPVPSRVPPAVGFSVSLSDSESAPAGADFPMLDRHPRHAENA